MTAEIAVLILGLGLWVWLNLRADAEADRLNRETRGRIAGLRKALKSKPSGSGA